MGISAPDLKSDLDALAGMEPAFARAIGLAGYPEPRMRDRGYATMLRTIIGQQVSVAAANSMWNKLVACIGDACDPAFLLTRDFDQLRACGLSRQKQAYLRSLAEMVVARSIDFDDLPRDDETAIALLTQIKGIGRWSAEIYLLFAEGRRDIWPAGDLAVQEAVKRLLNREARPAEKETRALAENWRPYRGAAAIFAWHCYNMDVI
jgi:DNA-3-methyladenine glycosylase II